MPMRGNSTSCTAPFFEKVRSAVSTTTSAERQETTSPNCAARSEMFTATGQCFVSGGRGQCVQGEKESSVQAGGGGGLSGRLIVSGSGSSLTSNEPLRPSSSVNE